MSGLGLSKIDRLIIIALESGSTLSLGLGLAGAPTAARPESIYPQSAPANQVEKRRKEAEIK